MKQRLGPYPSPSFLKQTASMDTSPMIGTISGEITTSRAGIPLGAVNVSGKVSNAWFSLLGCGRDDSNAHRMALNVKINGTSCLTTQPYIDANNGSAATQKSTKTSTDTGVVQAVINTSANTVALGDVITYDLTLTRTSSPTTEMNNVVVVVEIEPNP